MTGAVWTGSRQQARIESEKGTEMQPQIQLTTRRGFMGGLAAAGLYAQSTAPDIFQAAISGDVKRATEILDAQPPLVRAQAEDGQSPLHLATAAGKPEMV